MAKIMLIAVAVEATTFGQYYVKLQSKSVDVATLKGFGTQERPHQVTYYFALTSLVKPLEEVKTEMIGTEVEIDPDDYEVVYKDCPIGDTGEVGETKWLKAKRG